MKNYFRNIQKVLNYLPNKLQKKYYLVFFLLSIGGILETLSIAMFLPLISLLLEGEKKFYFLDYFYDFKNFETDILIQVFLILILIVYFIKSTFLTILDFMIQKLTARTFAELTNTLFEKYLKHPYKFYLNANSSILLRNLTTEISAFTTGIMEPVVQIAKEFFIILIIIIMLFSYNIQISFFVIFVSILLIFLIKNLLKNIIYDLAKREQILNGEKNMTMLESINGIKFIKAYKIENIFLKKFYNLLIKGVNIKYKITILKNLPRLWIEFVLIIIIICLGLIFRNLGYSMESFLSFVSVFVLAMIKILPAVLSIIRSINQYRQSAPSIELIDRELKFNINDFNLNIDISNNFSFENKINLEKLSFKYDGQSDFVLKDLSFEIKKNNQLIGIFGPSGSGKTTFIDILIGLYRPQKGNYYIDDKDFYKYGQFDKIFGYVPQNTFLFDDTIKNNILLTLKDRDFSDEKFNQILKEAELYDFVMSCKDKENTLIGENGIRISGGQRQRIGLARALLSNPYILVLDEATNALDADTEKNIFNTLKMIAKTKSVIVVSHDKIIWEYCNLIFKLENGKLNNEK
tara:strand:+ start:150 stop:1880 length:1731 start_codon:yes stop_codon:yes gene_type:complete